MTTEELIAQIEGEIEKINQTISDVLQAGEEYEGESGPSRRRTRFPKLEDLYARRNELKVELGQLNGTGGAFQMGY